MHGNKCVYFSKQNLIVSSSVAGTSLNLESSYLCIYYRLSYSIQKLVLDQGWSDHNTITGAQPTNTGHSWDTEAENALSYFLSFFQLFFPIIIIKQIFFLLLLFNADRHSYKIAYIFYIFVVVANRYGVDFWTFEIWEAAAAVHVMHANMSKRSSFLLTPHSLPSCE